MKLISACLLGIRCAWDGKDRYRNDKAIELLRSETLIPICPEQPGVLKTPRASQEIQGGTGEDVLNGICKVLNSNGQDVTGEFVRGAGETLNIARQFDIKEFIAKSRSPSAMLFFIVLFLVLLKFLNGDGVTTALLKRNGIRIIGEEDL